MYTCIINKDTDNIVIKNVRFLNETIDIKNDKFKLTVTTFLTNEDHLEYLFYLEKSLCHGLNINTISIYDEDNNLFYESSDYKMAYSVDIISEFDDSGSFKGVIIFLSNPITTLNIPIPRTGE